MLQETLLQILYDKQSNEVELAHVCTMGGIHADYVIVSKSLKNLTLKGS